jgi:hypothetical protein
MNKGRRIGAVVAATVAAVGMSSVCTVAPAAAAEGGPRPVSNWLRAVRANTPNWVNIYWRTDRRVCDAEVRVNGARVRVDYPGIRRNYTSFSQGDNLWPGRTDFTAIRVTPYFNRSGIALLRATITYDDCRPHSFTRRSSTVLTLPVIRNGWNNGHGDGGWDNGGHGNGGNGDGGWDHHGNGGNGDGGWDHHGNDGNDDHDGPRPHPTRTTTTPPTTTTPAAA